MKLIADLGMQYPNENSKQKRRYGLYECSFCGKIARKQSYNIKNKHTKSCGCMERFTHKMSYTRIYRIWKKIKARVNAKDGINYKNYVLRNITMCKEWEDFNKFYEDMKDGYSDDLSIDRIDNNKGYYKENCRWTNSQVQCSNTRILKSTNTSWYRGVTMRKEINKWKSQIKVNYKNIHIGYFETKLEAAKAYDQYIIDNNLPHTRNGVI